MPVKRHICHRHNFKQTTVRYFLTENLKMVVEA